MGYGSCTAHCIAHCIECCMARRIKCCIKSSVLRGRRNFPVPNSQFDWCSNPPPLPLRAAALVVPLRRLQLFFYLVTPEHRVAADMRDLPRRRERVLEALLERVAQGVRLKLPVGSLPDFPFSVLNCPHADRSKIIWPLYLDTQRLGVV